LLVEYAVEDDPLPFVGGRQTVIDSSGTPVGVIETVQVEQVQLHRVPLAHAVDEGEGHDTVAQWRTDHERFWQGDEMREYLQDPTFRVDDQTVVVLERFRLATE